MIKNMFYRSRKSKNSNSINTQENIASKLQSKSKGRRSIEGSLDWEYFGTDPDVDQDLIFIPKKRGCSISQILK